MKRLHRRSRRNKNAKILYFTGTLLLVTLVCVFSVGYAVNNQMLSLGGIAKIMTYNDVVSCSVEGLNNISSDLQVSTQIWSGTGGQITLTMNVPNANANDRYKLAIERLDGINFTGGWGFSGQNPTIIDGEGYSIFVGEDRDNGGGTMHGNTLSITQSIQITATDDKVMDRFTTGLRNGNVKVALIKSPVSEELICENHEWKLGGTVIEATENTKLMTLAVSGYQITPEFSPSTDIYKLNVPFEVDQVNIIANPEDRNSTVSGGGIVSLEPNKNTFEIMVTGVNGGTRSYTLEITRLPDLGGSGFEIMEGADIEYTNGYVQPGRTYQYTIEIENVADVPMRNWVLYVKIGQQSGNTIINAWSGNAYEYDPDTGIIALRKSSWAGDVIQPGAKYQLQGQFNCTETPEIIGFTYE